MGKQLAVTIDGKHKIGKKLFVTDENLKHRKGKKAFLTVGGVHKLVYSSGVEWVKYSCDVSTETVETYKRITPSGDTVTVTHSRDSSAAWWSSYTFDESIGFFGGLGATHHDFTGVEVTENDVIGLYIVYTAQVGRVTALNSVSDTSITVMCEVVDECESSESTFDVYSQGSTSYGTIEAEEGALPENGTLIEGSVADGYCILEIDGAYYYYVIQ